MAEATEEIVTSAEWDEAAAKARIAADTYRPICDGYLGGWVEESFYLAARAEFKASEAAFDAAWEIEVNRHR
mgnify:FL=1